MKHSWEWEEADLFGLIKAGIQESIDLDYKRCPSLEKTDSKKNEISKDVSAFANSAGGTIVYGMIEDGHVPKQIDVGFDPEEISKEWLEQIINSRIHRRIDGIRVKQINLSQSLPGNVAYIVHIPSSLRAPHQAADKKFYKRFNFESIPMEEYEIRDVAHRNDAPDLRVEINLLGDNPVLVDLSSEEDHSEPIELNFQIINDASTPAEHAVFIISIDSRLKIIEAKGFSDAGVHETPEPRRVFQYIWSPATKKIPLFEGITLALSETIKFAFPKNAPARMFNLAWRAKAPRMPEKNGQAVLLFSGHPFTVQIVQNNDNSK